MNEGLFALCFQVKTVFWVFEATEKKLLLKTLRLGCHGNGGNRHTAATVNGQ